MRKKQETKCGLMQIGDWCGVRLFRKRTRTEWVTVVAKLEDGSVKVIDKSGKYHYMHPDTPVIERE